MSPNTNPSVEPIFVDTNLFLRYLTDDVPEQARAVEELFRRAATGQVRLIANSLIIAEIIWTLESFYRLPRTDIREKVMAILNTPGLEISAGDLILQALTSYVDQHIDFIDAYTWAWMQQRELTRISTFDRRHFSRLKGITVLVPGQELDPRPKAEDASSRQSHPSSEADSQE